MWLRRSSRRRKNKEKKHSPKKFGGMAPVPPSCYATDLTRFNKIAIKGTPAQMAVDKEAIICYNFPLFYVYPALTRYLSILFLNILTLLACTHSSDNLFNTLMVLCEHENFLTSYRSTLFLHQSEVVPSIYSYFTFCNLEKKMLESIFS